MGNVLWFHQNFPADEDGIFTGGPGGPPGGPGGPGDGGSGEGGYSRETIDAKLEAVEARMDRRLSDFSKEIGDRLGEFERKYECHTRDTQDAANRMAQEVISSVKGLDKRLDAIGAKIDGVDRKVELVDKKTEWSEKVVNALDRTLKTGFTVLAFTLALVAALIAFMSGIGVWKVFVTERPTATLTTQPPAAINAPVETRAPTSKAKLK